MQYSIPLISTSGHRVPLRLKLPLRLGYFGTFSRACCRILRLGSLLAHMESRLQRELTHKLPCHSYQESQ